MLPKGGIIINFNNKKYIVIFIVIACIFFTKVLFSISQNKLKRVNSNSIIKKSSLKVSSIKPININSSRKYNTTELYNSSFLLRSSPFIREYKVRSEFNYDNKNSGNKDIITSIEENNLRLIGVAKKGDDFLAIVKFKDRIHFLELGETINKFTVNNITKEKIILSTKDYNYNLMLK